MTEHWTWGVTVASIIGTVANVYRRRWCFAVWLATNLLWCAADARAGIYSQAALSAIYAGLAVWGWIRWTTKEETT
jgi:nicotinamide riboside transporter PnuC